jgi:hypothetical protein
VGIGFVLRVVRTTVLGVAVLFLLLPGVALASGGFRWGPSSLVDPHATDSRAIDEAVSCPSAGFCAAVGSRGGILTSSDPSSPSWTFSVIGTRDLVAVSCASASFCVAFDDSGDVLSSSDPGGGASSWAIAHVDQAPTVRSGYPYRVSCPSATFCVAVDFAGNVLSSRDPSGGSGSWSVSHIDTAAFTDVSCPTETLCVAVDTDGNVATSTDPAGGAGAWSLTSVTGSPLSGVSCASESLCAAVDRSGAALTSTNPTGGANAWQREQVEPPPAPGGCGHISCETPSAVACPTVSLCVLIDNRGQALSSTDPTGGASTWNPVGGIVTSFSPVSLSCGSASWCAAVGLHGVPVWTTNDLTTRRYDNWGGEVGAPSSRPVGASCPSVSFCAELDGFGYLASSTDPGAGSAAWSVTRISSQDSPSGLSCPSPKLCVATTYTQNGDLLISNDPRFPGSWNVTSLGIGVSSVSCPTTSFCVAAADTDIAVTSDPTGGSGAWTVSSLPTGEQISSVSCSSPRLCVGVGSFGPIYQHTIFRSVDPAGGGSTWHSSYLDRPPWPLDGVSCSPAGLCAGIDSGGDVITSVNPGARVPSWRSDKLPFGGPAVINCSVRSLCVIVDGNDALSSRDPAGGAAAWQTSRVIPSTSLNGLVAVACPSASSCLAFDDAGHVFRGTAPTDAQIRALLRRELRPTGRAATIRALLRHRGYRFRAHELVPGKLRITWVRKSAHRSVVIARGTIRVNGVGSRPMTIWLTPTGKRVLRSQAVSVRAIGRFTPSAGHVITASRTARLRS